MKQLPNEIHEEITFLCKRGDELVKHGNVEEAKKNYIDSLKLLPSDHREWEAATWIYVAMGDMYFHLKNYEQAFKCFYNAVQCPQGLGNPYIHLRLGQLYFEEGSFDESADELTRAYMGGGLGILLEDDPKYLDFLVTKIVI
ncbi:tetratricopeptide repeat protein [Acinetobacter pittii]|uniref:tetratricopeptide repeat protein n=1 Tax=Acinetobacter pittii TaxID=48296 RepID=UPI002FEFC4F1